MCFVMQRALTVEMAPERDNIIIAARGLTSASPPFRALLFSVSYEYKEYSVGRLHTVGYIQNQQ